MKRIKKCIEDDERQKLEDELNMVIEQAPFTLFELIDEDGMTLLHLCAGEGVLISSLKSILSIVKDKHKGMINLYARIQEWANQVSFKDSLTPLHIAAYYGKDEIIDILTNKTWNVEADINCLNKHGHTLMHMAALGDRVATLYYLKTELKMDLMARDFSNSTPLHLAAYSPPEFYLDYAQHDEEEKLNSSALALTYILAWIDRDQMSVQDNQGRTPLHLSILSSYESMDVKTIRALLFRGAPKDVKDNANKTPLDSAKELDVGENKKQDEMRAELISYLQYKGKCIDGLGLKPTPLKKLERSYNLPILFIFMNLMTYAILITFIFPYEKLISIIINFGIELIMLIFWVITMCLDPGYMK